MATKNEKPKAELVVVGGGGAGLAAALAASENGCRSVVVLEKAGAPAGSTSMAHDIFGAESPVQKRSGGDHNHEKLFAEDTKYLRPIRTGPYYAIKGHASICDAIGGIKVNENMEVLDTAETPIPGLYAAGSASGCWESESYCYHLTGHLLGYALNSGRIAGENAVVYLSKK